MRRFASLLALALVAMACGGNPRAVSPSPSSGSSGSPGASPSGSASAPSASGGDLADVRIRVQEIATVEGGPLGMAVRSGDTGLYVADKGGRVWAIREGHLDPRPVLDISGRVSTGGEQGLLGLAFSADGRFLYVNYTDRNGDTNVVEYTMRGGVADSGSARRVLFIDQPFANHNGGNLVFGPDGYLYVGMGDGGSGGDPLGNGQNLQTLLGKMLRIDPRAGEGRSYRIPQDNPFVGRPDRRPEIWAYGLRNPWRYSFDRETGDLWVGDVGQSAREEVDFERAGSRGGRNYGWSLMEGTLIQSENLPAGLVRPIFEYETGSDGTCAIVGGYVYRGTAIPALRGAYLFSDNCGGQVRALRVQGGKVAQERALGPEVGGFASFGQDQDGELYALSLGGEVYKIVPD
ncbi:MAG TPA: PQQ-dependent sugar dehydrogenase [Actinomycetota bacterium]|nr:PQQ-dependent sugar dehydrogenase [Actinomycetota bacterium]